MRTSMSRSRMRTFGTNTGELAIWYSFDFLLQGSKRRNIRLGGSGSILFRLSQLAIDLLVEFLYLFFLIAEDNFLDLDMPVIMAVWPIFFLQVPSVLLALPQLFHLLACHLFRLLVVLLHTLFLRCRLLLELIRSIPDLPLLQCQPQHVGTQYNHKHKMCPIEDWLLISMK